MAITNKPEAILNITKVIRKRPWCDSASGFVDGINTSKPTKVQIGGSRTSEMRSIDRNRIKSRKSTIRSADVAQECRSRIAKSEGRRLRSCSGVMMDKKIANAKIK
jgi:hypothetical protein